VPDGAQAGEAGEEGRWPRCTTRSTRSTSIAAGRRAGGSGRCGWSTCRGTGRRFTGPEALLAYLQAVVRATESVGPRAGTLAEGDVPEEAQEEGGMQDRV
jgi:hypothetical protein